MSSAISQLPSYEQLPRRGGLRCAWGVFGASDTRGTLNLLTAQRRRAGAAEVQRGVAFSLDLALDQPEPPLFGREPVQHVITTGGGFGGISRFQDDWLHSFNTQVSSQWDGFRHVASIEHGYYNGLSDELLGIDTWSREPIVGRAVLADLGRWREAEGRPIDPDSGDSVNADELLACLRDQGTAVQPGDVLLVRTGWLEWWAGLATAERAERVGGRFPYPGLYPDERMARTLWDLHVAAVASDSPALESGPAGQVLTAYDAPIPPGVDAEQERVRRTVLHVHLLVMLGIPIGELFDLGALGADCAADRRYSCQFSSAPLHLRHGVASPPNAVAVK